MVIEVVKYKILRDKKGGFIFYGIGWDFIYLFNISVCFERNILFF